MCLKSVKDRHRSQDAKSSVDHKSNQCTSQLNGREEFLGSAGKRTLSLRLKRGSLTSVVLSISFVWTRWIFVQWMLERVSTVNLR